MINMIREDRQKDEGNQNASSGEEEKEGQKDRLESFLKKYIDCSVYLISTPIVWACVLRANGRGERVISERVIAETSE